VLIGAIVLFVAYFLVTQPEAAADLVRSAWDAVVGFFDAVLAFFTSLFDSSE
jgi:hypothetical protein